MRLTCPSFFRHRSQSLSPWYTSRADTSSGLKVTLATVSGRIFLIRIRPSPFAGPLISRSASHRLRLSGRREYGPSSSRKIHFPVRMPRRFAQATSERNSLRRCCSPYGPTYWMAATLYPGVRLNLKSTVMDSTRAHGANRTYDFGGAPRVPARLRRSRRVVRFVVRLRRKALPGADRPHDLGLQIRRDRLETAVLRRPERSALRRGPDGGRETEHLRDGRLRVDDRDLAFLIDVLDHPASALDLPERRAHEILGHVDEDLLDRLEQDPPALDHRAVDRRSRRRDDLGGPAVDGVFVEPRVDEAHLEPHRLLPGEGSLAHRLHVCLLDQLHRLVQVLDPFRRIDQHVRVVDPDNALRFVAVHAELLEFLREDLRVLDPLSRGDLARPYRIHDLVLERLDLHVEPVVFVRRLAFARAALAADALAVHDDRRARRDGGLVIRLDAVDRDLEVELAHARNEVLAGLLIDLDHDTRVRLRDEPEGLDKPREVRCGLRFHRDRHDRVGVMDNLLERLHFLVVAHRRAGDRILQTDDRDDIARIDLVDGDPVRADDHGDRLRALGLRHAAHPELLTAADLAGEQTACGDLAGLRIDDDLRDHKADRAVLIDGEHRFSDGALHVAFPDDRNSDLLSLQRIRQVADDHVQHDVVERRLLRELLHRAFLAVFVDVLERDPGSLHERHGQGPLVVRAPEGHAARFDMDHPFLAHVLGEPLADAVVDLRDDLGESLLHLVR